MSGNILALGFFDGVHRGHAALLHTATAQSQQRGLGSMAVSFTTHPSRLLSKESLPLLSTVEERRRLMLCCGVDDTLFLPFDEAMRSTAWEDFLARLTEQCHAEGYVVGYDYRFGRFGEGNSDRLAQWCAARALSCRIIPPVTLEGTVVSSTHIRSLLRSGDVAEAVRFLGHPYLYLAAPEGRRLPWQPDRLPLPPSRCLADITLPSSVTLPAQIVECDETGILLPFDPPAGELAVAITGRADKE